MAYRIDLSPRAIKDLESILADIPAANLPWRERLEDAILSLESMPERCLVVAKLSTSRRTVRRLLFLERGHTYWVYFTSLENLVNVLHIRHSSQRHLRRL